MSIGDFQESLTRAMLVGCNVSREIGRKGGMPERSEATTSRNQGKTKHEERGREREREGEIERER